MSLEQPEYSVVYDADGVEYRQYQAYLVTETVIEGADNYKAAAREGFKRLFRYISGNNESQMKIPMTKPVQQSRDSEKIAMTAPVEYMQQGNNYKISFMLPGKYTIDNAPAPIDKRLQIVPVESRTMAVIRYSGRWTKKNYTKYQSILENKLARQNIETIGEAQSAFYNAPFVPPFLRRNEIMIEVSTVPQQLTTDKVAFSH